MSQEPIRIAVAGAAGRMGREVARAVSAEADMVLAAAVDTAQVGQDVGELSGIGALGVAIEPRVAGALARGDAQVLVDFSTGMAAAGNALAAIERAVSPIIGATGVSPEDEELVRSAASEAGIGALLAPNFAIGAVLLMRFAAEAARYLPDAEIIELHHENKRDSPSGTALLTASRIAAARISATAPAGTGEARGHRSTGVPIHSVRLPGLVAHQEVLLGAAGQILTLRHDSLDRCSFMPGVLLAVRRVRSLTGLHIGLEAVMQIP